jgi:LCP family protein required for cell wall assembly
MDGIINAPSRQQLTGRPFAPRSLNGDTFRTNTRTIGDFKRPDGYHVANTPVSHAKAAAPVVPKQDNVGLHATLPGSKASPRHRFGRRSHHTKSKKLSFRELIKTKKFWLRSGLAIIGLVLIVGGFLFAQGYFNLHKVFKGGGSAAALNDNVDPTLLKGEGDGRVNILLLGRGGDGHAGADLTDTLLLASIDPVNKKAALVSLPRDLWVTGSAGGSSKINAVFAFAKEKALAKGSSKKDAEDAGLKAIQTQVESVLGVSIHYRTMVDFKAFQDAVNTVGGVDVNVTEDTAVSEHLWNETTRQKYFLDVTPGLQHFDGQRALFYARSRHTSPRGDFDRAERQRLLIEALSKKIASAGTYTNPVKLSQLMDNFGDHVTTDMSINDAVHLVKLGKGIGSNFDSVDLADPAKPLFKTGMIGNQSVVMPTAGTGDYSEIQALIRSRLKDGYITKENANISVLNGTVSPGLATEKADELKTYGYNVGTVDSAPTSDYEKTVIVDLTKGKNKKPYTKNYLEKRFGVKSTTKLPDTTIKTGNASFVIILGKNETLNR